MDNIKNFGEEIILEMIQEIERKDMPQVRGKDTDEVLKIFDESGIKYEQGQAKCGDLSPTQEDFIPEKLESFKEKIQKPDWEVHPLFVSKEGNILDGHHRWMAYKEIYGDDFQIPVTKVDLPLEQALQTFDDSASGLGESRYNNSFLAQPKKVVVKEAAEGKTIAAYPGRFQPYHAGHNYSRDAMKKKFGDVYIATSNVVDPVKSPFNFVEKKQIMKKMFGIPANRIISVKSPYNATSYEKIGDPSKDVLVLGLGEKDASRLKGKYFSMYKGNEKNLKPFGEQIYIYIVPQLQMKVAGKTISGTVIREVFKKGTDKAKQQLFKKLYGKFDQRIYDLITSKLNESIILSSDVIEYYITEVNIKQLLLETSQAGDSQVDDGPATFYKHPDNYHKDVDEITGKLGWQVIDYLAGDKEEYASQRYKYDHVSDVSFGDVGVRDTTYPDPIAKYKSYIRDIAAKMGYSIVDWLMTGDKKEDMIDDPKSTMATEEPLVQDASGASKPLDEGIFSKNWWTENIMTDKQSLNEGGAYGHLAHPFDDRDLTFGDLKTMIDTALEGNLEMTQEKTDGQNLMVSWKDGKLVAARNKGQIKNFGANALDKAGVKNMFSGRGEIENAFTFAMDDLEKAIKGLSQKQKDQIFGNGKKFMSFEVMYPATQNVIPYGLPLLLFHGTKEYDQEGNVIGGSKEEAKILADMIRSINQEVQKNYTIGDVPVLKLPKTADFSKQKSKFNNKLNTLKKKFKLKDSDMITLYHQNWWEDFITKQAKKNKYGIPNGVLMNLVKRWAYSDKSYSINNMKKDIDNEKFLKWARDFDKKDHANQLKKNIEPFELLFLELGAQVLKNMNQLLTANPEKATQQIKKDVEKSIKDLEASNDVTKINKLKVQLDRLKAIGGMDAIVPTEGITFMYKDKLYKLTGTFAPVNALLGILKFGN
jgi:phosphopantetheine adenylyltransferase